MNLTEHLLCILAEECSEVAKRASKAMRFGLEEVESNQDRNNAERLVEEIDDLLAVIELLQDDVGLDEMCEEPWVGFRDRIDKKKEKVRLFLKYSQGLGTCL